uniref:Thyroglobulin type-1 domain-containing protein n=1 Tax=Scleropages formosus TaxID=113540 RepID=A0A8C9SZU4_SCLFO
MAEVQNEPLLGAPGGETVVTVRSKAFKVAGFTVLACLLIAGQAISVYFVLNQRNKLGDLEQSFSKQLHHKPSGESTVSPSTLQRVLSLSVHLMKLLQPSSFHGHRPQCDMDGNYLPMQCQNKYCWCVDENGIPIPGSKGVGVVQCAGNNGKAQNWDVTPASVVLSYMIFVMYGDREQCKFF